MTMSTIGYGDVSPKTQYERMYEIYGMILGASVYAYMVGSICSIVASMNAASAEFNQQMDRSVTLLGPPVDIMISSMSRTCLGRSGLPALERQSLPYANELESADCMIPGPAVARF